MEFVAFHVHTPATKRDALGLKPQTLLDARVSAELDFASRAEHTVPGKIETAMEGGDDLARSAGITSSPRNRAIGGHSASRDRADRCQYLLSHRFGH